MADQPQTPQVGVVGQQAGQQQTQQQQTQIPGVQQPPIPSAEMIAKVQAEQKRATQKQIAEAQARAGYAAGQQQSAPAQGDANNRFAQPAAQPSAQPAQQPTVAQQPAAPAQQPAPAQNPAMSQIPAAVAATMPPGMRPPQAQQPAPPPAPSPVAGMTAEQVLAGPTQQQNFTPVYANQPPQPVYQTQPLNYPQQQQAPSGNRIAAIAGQEKQVEKPLIPWFPIRSPKGSVNIELTDCIIKSVPAKGPPGESNAGAKVVLALFSEILALRDEIAQLRQIAGQSQVPQNLLQRVHNLESTLFEQRQAMNQRARGVREQIAMLQLKGHSPDQILAQLSGQQVAAQQMVDSGVMPAPQHGAAPQAQTAAAAPAPAAAPASDPAPQSEPEPAPEGA